MTSTGEVASFGEEIHGAFLKAWLSTGTSLPQKKTVLLSTGDIEQKARFLPSVHKLKEKGYTIFATEGTAKFYEMNDIKMHVLHWPLDYSLKPNVLDFLKTKEIELVINIPKSNEREELDNDYIIRRIQADYSIPLITNLQLAKRFVEAIYRTKLEDLNVKSWDEYN